MNIEAFYIFYLRLDYRYVSMNAMMKNVHMRNLFILLQTYCYRIEQAMSAKW